MGAILFHSERSLVAQRMAQVRSVEEEVQLFQKSHWHTVQCCNGFHFQRFSSVSIGIAKTVVSVLVLESSKKTAVFQRYRENNTALLQKKQNCYPCIVQSKKLL